jgi:hypothetical protein
MKIRPKIAALPDSEWYFKDLPDSKIRECFHWEVQRAVYFEQDNEIDRAQVASFRRHCKVNKAGFFEPKEKGGVFYIVHELALLPDAVWPRQPYQDVPETTLNVWRDLKRKFAYKEFTLDDEAEYRANLPHPGLGLYQMSFSRFLRDCDTFTEWKQWPLSAMFKEPWMRPSNGEDEKSVLSVMGKDLVILRIDFSQPDTRLKAQFAAWLEQVRRHAPVAAVKKKTKSTTDRGGRPTMPHMRTCLKHLGVYRLSQHYGSQSNALNSGHTATAADCLPKDEVEWSKSYRAAKALLKKYGLPKYLKDKRRTARKRPEKTLDSGG